jgi:hypothetical protein
MRAQSILASKESHATGGFLVFNDQLSLPGNLVIGSGPDTKNSREREKLQSLPMLLTTEPTPGSIFISNERPFAPTEERRKILFGPKSSQKG